MLLHVSRCVALEHHRYFLCLAKLCLLHSMCVRLYLTCFFLQLVIGLMYMAYPQACQHKLTFLLRLRPWCNRLYLKYFLPTYISILAMTVLIDGCFAHIQRYIYRYFCLIYIDSASNKMSGYGMHLSEFLWLSHPMCGSINSHSLTATGFLYYRGSPSEQIHT